MGSMALLIMVIFMVALFWFSSRSQKKNAQLQQERLNAGMVPGTWMMTSAGFYGRFVDQDGDVVILETLDGVETFWDRQAIRVVKEPPFAQQSDENSWSEDNDLLNSEAGTADNNAAKESLSVADKVAKRETESDTDQSADVEKEELDKRPEPEFGALKDDSETPSEEKK